MPGRHLLALAVLLSLIGCQREQAREADDQRVQRSGCDAPSASPGVHSSELIEVNGVARRYQLVVPPGDPRAPRPLVLVFHGKGGNMLEMRAGVGRALESAAQGKAVFVYPDGVDDGWPNRDGKDVAFVDALLRKLAGAVCYDPKRVFATGFSSGAIMSNTLGCIRGGVIRGIAPMSGAGPRVACNDRPVAAWMSHGAGDGTLREAWGEGSRDHWLRTNGCSAASHPTPPSPCVAYDGCGATPVVWCEFPGGHEIPGFAPAAIWDFFEGLK